MSMRDYYQLNGSFGPMYKHGIKFPNDEYIFKDQLRFIMFLETNYLFLEYPIKDVMYSVSLKLDEKTNVSSLIYEMLMPKLHLDIPINPTRDLRTVSTIIQKCPACKITGVVDWVGAITKKFTGYCHKETDAFLESCKSYHYRDTESYTIHLLELELEIKRIEDRDIQGMFGSHDLGWNEKSILRFFNSEMTDVEKYVYNYLSYDDRSRLQYHFDTHPQEFKQAIKLVPDRKIKTINAILMVKNINESIIDSDLYQVCPTCNGAGFLVLPRVETDETFFRIRSFNLGSINCPSLSLLEEIVYRFTKYPSSRLLLRDLRGMLHYGENKRIRSGEVFGLLSNE